MAPEKLWLVKLSIVTARDGRWNSCRGLASMFEETVVVLLVILLLIEFVEVLNLFVAPSSALCLYDSFGGFDIMSRRKGRRTHMIWWYLDCIPIGWDGALCRSKQLRHFVCSPRPSSELHHQWLEDSSVSPLVSYLRAHSAPMGDKDCWSETLRNPLCCSSFNCSIPWSSSFVWPMRLWTMKKFL